MAHSNTYSDTDIESSIKLLAKLGLIEREGLDLAGGCDRNSIIM